MLLTHTALVDIAVIMMGRLTIAIAVVCITAFVPNHSYARDDGRFTNSPLKVRVKTDYAALLPMVSVCRMSIGTRKMDTIVYDFRENGLWCLTRR
jgi:hypothetical protein